ncbi:MAG: DUF502 domain-containing protein [Pseudomonadota bacterium]
MGKKKTDKGGDKARALIQPVKRSSLLQRLRNNFLTGIVVIAPIGITVYLTWAVVEYVDRQVLPQVLPLLPQQLQPEEFLPFSLPGMGLVFFILFAIAVGSMTKNFFGRELLRIGERWVDRMPVIRSLYNALKQIAETIFTQSKSSFEKACLVEYPRRGTWAIAFVSTTAKGEVRTKTENGSEMLSVFLPTTPNPTSGFLLFVERDDVIMLDMTVEEAAKMVISAGLVAPHDPNGKPEVSGDQTGPGDADPADPVPATAAEHPEVAPVPETKSSRKGWRGRRKAQGSKANATVATAAASPGTTGGTEATSNG